MKVGPSKFRMCIYPLAELTLSLAIFITVIQCNAACQPSEPAG